MNFSIRHTDTVTVRNGLNFPWAPTSILYSLPDFGFDLWPIQLTVKHRLSFELQLVQMKNKKCGADPSSFTISDHDERNIH